MSTVGIICEYNPFHAGHARQLSAARSLPGVDTVVAVMSEYVTQRGTLAVADPYARAEIAVRCGVDLVVGLPYPYSASSAEFFADAGVAILNAMGVDMLHFGSESGDLDALTAASELIFSASFLARMDEVRTADPSRGIMEIREKCFLDLTGKPLPGGSNDHLAMAYLHALRASGSPMLPVTIDRNGQDYLDDSSPANGILPSSGALRAMWRSVGLPSLSPLLPQASFDVLCRESERGSAPLGSAGSDALLLGYYRLTPARTLAAFHGLGSGVAERLCDAAKETSSSKDFLYNASTRAYTSARLARALLAGFCRVTEEDVRRTPAYVRVLAANERGRAYLSSIRKTCALPILSKPSRIPSTPAAKRQRQIEERLCALVAAAHPVPVTPADLWRRSPVML